MITPSTPAFIKNFKYSTAGKNDGFSLIKESGAKAYCYKIADVSTDLKYTDEQVVKAFSLFADYEQN